VRGHALEISLDKPCSNASGRMLLQPGCGEQPGDKRTQLVSCNSDQACIAHARA
jgi:hypothetical protein